uniref:Uncharacterized protein n=1 Tax=Romanomermis culicivorax TaxID=13658 RepID=A0A915IPK6_ROMCU
MVDTVAIVSITFKGSLTKRTLSGQKQNRTINSKMNHAVHTISTITRVCSQETDSFSTDIGLLKKMIGAEAAEDEDGCSNNSQTCGFHFCHQLSVPEAKSSSQPKRAANSCSDSILLSKRSMTLNVSWCIPNTLRSIFRAERRRRLK